MKRWRLRAGRRCAAAAEIQGIQRPASALETTGCRISISINSTRNNIPGAACMRALHPPHRRHHPWCGRGPPARPPSVAEPVRRLPAQRSCNAVYNAPRWRKHDRNNSRCTVIADRSRGGRYDNGLTFACRPSGSMTPGQMPDYDVVLQSSHKSVCEVRTRFNDCDLEANSKL